MGGKGSGRGSPTGKAKAKGKGKAKAKAKPLGRPPQEALPAVRLTAKRPAAFVAGQQETRASAARAAGDWRPAPPLITAFPAKAPPPLIVAPPPPPPPQPTLVRALAGHGLVAKGGRVVPFPVVGCAVLSSGESLATAGEDGTVRVWDTASGELQQSYLAHKSGVTSMALFPDGKRLLTTGADGAACVWRSADGALLRRLEGHGGPVIGGAVYPNGDRVITIAEDGSSRIWDVATDRALAPVAGEGVSAVAVFPDGDRVAVGSADGKVEIWCGHTGDLQCEFKGHTDRVSALHVLAEGHRLLSVAHDGFAVLWDTDGRELGRAPQGTDPLLCAAASPCGSRLLLGTASGTARLCNADGRILTEWAAAPPASPVKGAAGGGDADRAVRAAAFLPDGRRVLLAGARGAQLWELPKEFLAPPKPPGLPVVFAPLSFGGGGTGPT